MHNRLLNRFLSALVVFVMVFLSFAPSWSADWEVSPYVVIVEEYNDNILFSSKGQELDDFVTYERPRMKVRYSTDWFRMSLNSGVERKIYVDYYELNATEHDHRLALSCGLSRTLDLRAGSYFREDMTLETELTEEGLLVNWRENRRKYGGDLGFNYDFSPFFTLSGDWIRRTIEYPEFSGNFYGYWTNTFKLVPRYVLSHQTSLVLNMQCKRTKYDDPTYTTIWNYSISPSFRHDFEENFYVAGGAGYRYTDQKTDNGDETTGGFIFHLSFHRDWEKVAMELLASRDQYATTDRRSIERDRLTITGTYRLTKKLKTSLAATFRRNRVNEGTGTTDYYTISPVLTYSLTRTIGLKASVDYAEYDYKDVSNEDRERFRAKVTLDLKWPRLWSGH